MSERRDVDDVVKKLFEETNPQDKWEAFKTAYRLGVLFPSGGIINLVVYEDGKFRMMYREDDKNKVLEGQTNREFRALMMALRTLLAVGSFGSR